MHYAFDTGFFFVLIDRTDDTVTRVWNELLAGDASGLVSGVVLVELKRHALRGRLPEAPVDTILELTIEAFDVRWMQSVNAANRIARLSHGEGLSMADSMVLHAAVKGDVDALYTNDSDLLTLDGFGDLDIVAV